MADKNATISFAITTTSADQKRSTSVGMPLRVGVFEGQLTEDGIDMINERLSLVTGSLDTDTAQPMLDGINGDDDDDDDDDGWEDGSVDDADEPAELDSDDEGPEEEPDDAS